jgi:hypothetical protein
MLLNLLADQALAVRGHKWKPFVYGTKGGSSDVGEEGEGLDDDEIADDVRNTILLY